jgi:ubiquitin
MPTKVRPILNRLPQVRLSQVRPADSRPATRSGRRPSTARQDSKARRHTAHSLAVVIIIVGLATAGCAQFAEPSAGAPTPVSQHECVDAVFTVLSGIIAKPQDDQPFEDFVNHYGTQSATYTAYRDSYNPFYNEAVQHGIKAAENDVRTVVTRDCTTDS